MARARAHAVGRAPVPGAPRLARSAARSGPDPLLHVQTELPQHIQPELPRHARPARQAGAGVHVSAVWNLGWVCAVTHRQRVRPMRRSSITSAGMTPAQSAMAGRCMPVCLCSLVEPSHLTAVPGMITLVICANLPCAGQAGSATQGRRGAAFAGGPQRGIRVQARRL